MAYVTLPNGKTIDIDINWWLNMSDEEYSDLIAMNAGFETSDPFHGSALHTTPFELEEEDEEDVNDEILRTRGEEEDLLNRDDI